MLRELLRRFLRRKVLRTLVQLVCLAVLVGRVSLWSATSDWSHPSSPSTTTPTMMKATVRAFAPLAVHPMDWDDLEVAVEQLHQRVASSMSSVFSSSSTTTTNSTSTLKRLAPWWRRYAQLVEYFYTATFPMAAPATTIRTSHTTTQTTTHTTSSRRRKALERRLIQIHALLFPHFPYPATYSHPTDDDATTTSTTTPPRGRHPPTTTTPTTTTTIHPHAIVLCVYDKVMDFAVTTILHIRRNLHSTRMPIFVFFLDDADLSPRNQHRLQAIGHQDEHKDKDKDDHQHHQWEPIRLFSIQKLLDGTAPTGSYTSLNPRGFGVKPLALLLAPCHECILMDADAFLLMPPEHFFAGAVASAKSASASASTAKPAPMPVPEYQSSGTLFFHDRTMGVDPVRGPVGRDWFLDILSAADGDDDDASSSSSSRTTLLLDDSRFMSGELGHEQESGLVVVDKRQPRSVVALEVASIMNTGPHAAHTWAVVYGDKETFWMAMELVRADYSWNGKRAGNLGTYVPVRLGWSAVCGGTMVHVVASDPERLLWFNGGLYHDKYREEEEDAGNAGDHATSGGDGDVSSDKRPDGRSSSTGTGSSGRSGSSKKKATKKNPVATEFATFEAWVMDGGWDIDKTHHCMRSILGGWLYWVPVYWESLGRAIRWLTHDQRELLQALMRTFKEVLRQQQQQQQQLQ